MTALKLQLSASAWNTGVDPTKVMEVCSFIIKQPEMPIGCTDNKNAYYIMYKNQLT